MKKYTVLENDGVRIAVPQGFSWAAFLFPWAWGFYKKLMLAWGIYIAIYGAAMAVYVCQTKTAHDLQIGTAALKAASIKANAAAAAINLAYSEHTNAYASYIQRTNALAAAVADVSQKSEALYIARTNATACAETFAKSWCADRLSNYSNVWATAKQAAAASDAYADRYNAALEKYRNARDAYTANAYSPSYAAYSAALDRARDVLSDADAKYINAHSWFTNAETAAELIPFPTQYDSNYYTDYNNTLTNNTALFLAKVDFDTACFTRDQASLAVNLAVAICNQAYASYTNAVVAANAAGNEASAFSGQAQMSALNSKQQWLSVLYSALIICGFFAQVFFGTRGNKWVEAYFIKNGFKVVGPTWAGSKREALLNIKLTTQPQPHPVP